MNCRACGQSNAPSRAACGRCHAPLGTAREIGEAQTLVLRTPQAPRQVDHTAAALDVLRTGTGEEKIAAREYLAGIFESRDMVEEAIELLVENARQGVRTIEIFERLSNLYSRQGQAEYASMALHEATKLRSQSLKVERRLWSGAGPVDLHQLDQPPPRSVPQSSPIPEVAPSSLESLLANVRELQERAEGMLRHQKQIHLSDSIVGEVDALLIEVEQLETVLQSPEWSIRQITADRGVLKGTLTWARLDQSRGVLSRMLAKLRNFRFEVGFSLGEDAYVEEVLRREIRRFASIWTVGVQGQRAEIVVGAPVNTIQRHVLKAGRRAGQLVRKERPQRDVNRDYKDLIAEHGRSLARHVFSLAPSIELVSLSIMTSGADPMTGHPKAVCWLATEVNRDIFDRIVHERVQPENALKNGILRFEYKERDYVLQPVQPFIAQIQQPSLDEVVNLDTIDPLEFERLVRDLLVRMGFEAKLTKASHDGGIDVVAINPAPIVGGTVIVQCKRYSSVVGSPVIRDLYGALTDSGAGKGILITTSWFSPDARKFAEGKRIELIDRSELERLIRHHLI